MLSVRAADAALSPAGMKALHRFEIFAVDVGFAEMDAKSKKLFLPTAEFEPLQSGERRPKLKPGTFVVLVVSK